MDIRIDTSEVDDMLKKLEDLEGTHEVSTDETMTDEFIREHTKFSNWKEMMGAFPIESDEDFEKPEFSQFVADHSSFKSFDEMLEAAGGEWVNKKLEGLG